MSTAISIVWFRHDLRLFDHTALQMAIRHQLPIIALYVFDTEMLNTLADNDRRISFIHAGMNELQQSLAQKKIPLWVLHGRTENELPSFAKRMNAKKIFCAEEYQPHAIKQDNQVCRNLDNIGCELIRVTDHVVFAKADIMSPLGRPYTAFSVYKKAWLHHYRYQAASCQTKDDWHRLAEQQKTLPESMWLTPSIPSLVELGFQQQKLIIKAGETAANLRFKTFLKNLEHYHFNQNFPALKLTSQLSVYIRYGMLSPRQIIKFAYQANHDGSKAWLNKLIWREFFQQLLFHFPKMTQESLQPAIRHLTWPNNLEWFERWQNGQTGFPLIDAAMRQLINTGLLHHRLRQTVANFLVKNLLIDWRLGEAWFACQLLDYDTANNTGNWQQVLGVGDNAHAYLQTFNPVLQSQKFDPDGQYIRRHIPELAHLKHDIIHTPWLAKPNINTHGYLSPIINHAEQSKHYQNLIQNQLS